MWFVFAILSAIFAALTSILAKVGHLTDRAVIITGKNIGLSVEDMSL